MRGALLKGYVKTDPALGDCLKMMALMRRSSGGIPLFEQALQLPFHCATHAFTIAKL
jgi:hypothetical protein